MTDKRKMKIALVGSKGIGSPHINMAIAAFQASHPEVVIITATDKMKEAVEGIKQATIETEKFNKAIADMKAIPALEFENAIMNKPFYHNVPKYRRKRRW